MAQKISADACDLISILFVFVLNKIFYTRLLNKIEYFKEVIWLAKDLICGMDVDEKTAQWKSEYKGNTYYFCAERCKQVFDKQPDHFTK